MSTLTQAPTSSQPRTLYDEYDPNTPWIMPMHHLYRSQSGPFPGRVVEFAGIVEARAKEMERAGEGILNLWLLDFFGERLDCHLTSREGLRAFQRVMPAELGEAGRMKIEQKARQYAAVCTAFAEFLSDPGASICLDRV